MLPESGPEAAHDCVRVRGRLPQDRLAWRQHHTDIQTTSQCHLGDRPVCKGWLTSSSLGAMRLSLEVCLPRCRNWSGRPTMIIKFPRVAKFVFAMAVLAAMLVSPITAQAQSD